ncbi:unnamed protein product [Toxocara canis]|uniref:Uncharacterized protein n=1 Tax=Toxocara canis TaxID=6265 RepID=A0A183ULN0_TOXCA|nr:unnamed protein product [Toxocara canis]
MSAAATAAPTQVTLTEEGSSADEKYTRKVLSGVQEPSHTVLLVVLLSGRGTRQDVGIAERSFGFSRAT